MARPPLRLFHFVFEPHDGRAFCADSEEKREPVSDIDTAVTDSLKVLDLVRTSVCFLNRCGCERTNFAVMQNAANPVARRAVMALFKDRQLECRCQSFSSPTSRSGRCIRTGLGTQGGTPGAALSEEIRFSHRAQRRHPPSDAEGRGQRHVPHRAFDCLPAAGARNCAVPWPDESAE